MLAGGAARRMGGADKAALQIGGRTLLDRVLDAASAVCSELVVVGPPRPTTHERVRFLSEPAPGRGPAPAITAGLGAVPAADVVVVLAVDLPFVGADDLRQLVAAVAAGAPAAAARGPAGRPHPLLAAYRADDLRKTAAADLEDAPAARLVPSGTVVVELSPAATLDVDTKDDLAAARARARGQATR